MVPWIELVWWQWVGILGLSVWNALSSGVETIWESGLIFLGSVLILTLSAGYLVGFTRKSGRERDRNT